MSWPGKRIFKTHDISKIFMMVKSLTHMHTDDMMWVVIFTWCIMATNVIGYFTIALAQSLIHSAYALGQNRETGPILFSILIYQGDWIGHKTE